MSITKATRQTIRTILSRSSEYDADTLRITADGIVTATKDPDKTYHADPVRYHVAHVSEMIAPDGSIREGW